MTASELSGLALGPALAVGLGLPLVLLVMTEAIQVAGRRGHPIAGPLRWTRNWFMPVLALVLFLRVAVGLPADLVVFDPERIGAGALQRVYDLPAGQDRLISQASGVEAVFVNGQRLGTQAQGQPAAGQLLRQRAGHGG
jgi:hypothetical protein